MAPLAKKNPWRQPIPARHFLASAAVPFPLVLCIVCGVQQGDCNQLDPVNRLFCFGICFEANGLGRGSVAPFEFLISKEAAASTHGKERVSLEFCFNGDYRVGSCGLNQKLRG